VRGNKIEKLKKCASMKRRRRKGTEDEDEDEDEYETEREKDGEKCSLMPRRYESDKIYK
jgi:hypothetical protein